MSSMKSPITLAQFEAAEEHYKANPGDWVGAAKKAGIDARTAKRVWLGPPWRFGECVGKTPVREVFANSEQAKRQRAAELEAASRAAAAEELEKARKLEAEAQQADEMILRLVRNDVLGGLNSLAKMHKGIDKLAERLATELARGTDAAGNQIVIDPMKGMKIIGDFTLAAARMTEAAVSLTNLARLKASLPTMIVGLEAASMTLEDAEREVALAGVAVQKAREWGVLTAIPGGKGK